MGTGGFPRRHCPLGDIFANYEAEITSTKTLFCDWMANTVKRWCQVEPWKSLRWPKESFPRFQWNPSCKLVSPGRSERRSVVVVTFTVCGSLSQGDRVLLNQPLHSRGWHHAPHFHSRAFLFLTAGAVGSLSCPFVGGNHRSNHHQKEDQQQGGRHWANGGENVWDQIICQLEGVK